MEITVAVLFGLLGFISSIAGAALARKEWNPVARNRFFYLFVTLALATLALTIWQAILTYHSGEESKKVQLGDADHPPYVSVISLPGQTKFIRVNTGNFPAYVYSIRLYDGTHKVSALRAYSNFEIASHSAIADDKSWTAEDDDSEHHFTVEISTRSGLYYEELILRRAGNSQWMKAARVTQGMRTLEQEVDSAWPLDSNGQTDWR